MTHKITSRLIELLRGELDHCGGNLAALARKIGINPSYLFKYLRGTVKSVQADTWQKLCQYFPELDDRPLVIRGNTMPVKGHLRQFPVIRSDSAAVACRFFYLPIAEYATDNPVQMVSFSQGREGDFAIEVVGDSMLPWYPEGTILLVRPHVRLRTGDPVVAILASGEVVFKIFLESQSLITLASLNGDDGGTYQFSKSDHDSVKALYKVIQSMRDEQAIWQALQDKGLHPAWKNYVQASNLNQGQAKSERGRPENRDES